VDTLSTLSSSSSVTLVSLTKALNNAWQSMARLHFMVHCSPLVRAHLKAIESTLFEAMDPKRLQGKSMDTDVDEDGGFADTRVEIDFARVNHRVGEEYLWLLVRYQDALRSLTAQSAIPTHAVTFSLFTPPAVNSPETPLKTPIKIVLSDRKGVTYLPGIRRNTGIWGTSGMQVFNC